MEPIVKKKKKLYLLSFKSRLELSSSHSRADGRKGSTHIKSDKGGVVQRWGPKTLPGFPGKGVPCRIHTWQRRPEMTNCGLSASDANTLIPVVLSQRLEKARLPWKLLFSWLFWFLLSQKEHRKVLPMCQELHQVSKAPAIQGSQGWGFSFYSANAPEVLSSSGPLHALSEVPTLCKCGSFFLFLQRSSPRPPHPRSLTQTP